MRLPSPSAAPILGLLESLRCGGFLLDPLGRVLSLNAIARDCLGDGLVLGSRHLRAIDHAVDGRLQIMIASALARRKGPDVPTSVAVQRRCRLPLVIRALSPDGDAVDTPDSATLLLLAVDPELRHGPPRDILRQAFGLTSAEADIAIGIASGRTLAEIAAARGVTTEAVRLHSKRVFAKTQTRGQAELTGVLTRLAFLLPAAEVR
jgi:DNA-binding CsgD family transcriptional regulator